MTINNLEKILKHAKDTKQSYPMTFHQLKEAGVEVYEIHLETYKNIYRGSFGTWSENPPEGYSALMIADSFSRDEVMTSLRRHQSGQTSFMEWLSEMAQAGVSHYRVDMDKKTVFYYDVAESNVHEEMVP